MRESITEGRRRDQREKGEGKSPATKGTVRVPPQKDACEIVSPKGEGESVSSKGEGESVSIEGCRVECLHRLARKLIHMFRVTVALISFVALEIAESSTSLRYQSYAWQHHDAILEGATQQKVK